MTLIIQNADNNLIEMLDIFKKTSKADYRIYQENEIYTKELIKSIKADEKEIKKQIKNKTLKTYSSAEEAFADL